MTFRYSRGRDIHDTHPHPRIARDFAELVDALDRDRAHSKAKAAYLCGPLNGDGRRCADGAQPRAWLAVDLDKIAADVFAEVRLWFAGKFSGCGWATHSSTKEAPRERAVIELDREATRGECIAIGRVIMADLDAEFGDAVLVDASTFRGEQPMFVPPAGVALARYLGDPLNVDRYLEAARDLPVPTAPPAEATGAERKIADGQGRRAYLLKWAAQLNWRGMPPEAVRVAVQAENLRMCDPPKPEAEVDRLTADILRRYGDQRGRDQHADAGHDALPTKGFEDRPALFRVVDLTDPSEPAPITYVWEDYVPAGVVTLIGAHGGTGKSILGLMLAICVALGLPLFGVPTRRGVVVVFSAEDPAELVRYRLQWICRALQVDPAELPGRLHVLDATAGHPVLFHEVAAAGSRLGATTPTFDALRAFVDEHTADLLIVDNASDTYDANEIDRARVRGFMRSLTAIAQDRQAGVVLLAHIDKGTARGERSTSEGYSGSTAWHNSARSRLFMGRDSGGTLTLEHQKHNLGRLREPLRLVWPEHGIPTLDAPTGGVVEGIARGIDTKSLLRLIHEFTARGEFVGTAGSGTATAPRLLRNEPTYPRRLHDGAVLDLLRQAERRGWLARVTFRDGHRKMRERWDVTAEGSRAAEITPSAPVAPVARQSSD